MRIRNKKIPIIVMAIGTVFLIFGLIYKFILSESTVTDEQVISSMESSDVARSELEESNRSEETNSSETEEESEASASSEKSKFLDSYLDKVVPETQQKEDDNALMIQAADQILRLGGVWTMEEDPQVQIGFDGSAYTISGVNNQPISEKYTIEKVVFGEPTEKQEYSYLVTLSNDQQLKIAVLGNDIYILTVSADTFPELGVRDETSFLKSAKISLGNQRIENGLTELERDQAGERID